VSRTAPAARTRTPVLADNKFKCLIPVKGKQINLTAGKTAKELFMKKGKILVVGLIALLMAGGLVLASCRAGCEGAGTCEVKSNKGSVCSDSACAANQAFMEGKNGKCDC